MADLAIYIGCAFLIIGAAFSLLAAIGVLRLPDLLTRMHAASKAGAVGGGFILLAVAVVSFELAITLRAVIGIVFLLLTTPLSAHLLAKVNLRTSEKGKSELISDEMKTTEASV